MTATASAPISAAWADRAAVSIVVWAPQCTATSNPVGRAARNSSAARRRSATENMMPSPVVPSARTPSSPPSASNETSGGKASSSSEAPPSVRGVTTAAMAPFNIPWTLPREGPRRPALPRSPVDGGTLGRLPELLGLGRPAEREGGGSAPAHHLGDEVEVSGPHLGLVPDRRVAERGQLELALLETDIRGHPLASVGVRELEHRRVQRVEAGERDELEPVAHLRELLGKPSDRPLIQVPPPVEGGGAVVREELARERLVDALGERPCLAEVRSRGLAPQDVGQRGVGAPSGDGGLHPVPDPEEPLGGPLAGEERSVAGIGVAREQSGRLGVGPRDEHRRDAEHVGGQARGGERREELPRR